MWWYFNHFQTCNYSWSLLQSVWSLNPPKYSHIFIIFSLYRFPGSRPETVFQVRLGNINICDIQLSVSRLFSVQQVYVHEKYHETNENIYFDVALAVLNTTAEQYMPICLPNKSK